MNVVEEVFRSPDAEVMRQVRDDFPQLDLIQEESVRTRTTEAWALLLNASQYDSAREAPAFPNVGVGRYDLAAHTRQVVLNSVNMADTLGETWGIAVEQDLLLSAAFLHDASKVLEYDPDGTLTAEGSAFLHAQLGGVVCRFVNLPLKVAYMVTIHPFTPPHVHIKPQNLEILILTYADLMAADCCYFVEGLPTHLDIEKRFFSLD